jgi:hypothetical protein
MRSRLLPATLLFWAFAARSGSGKEAIPKIPPADFDRLLKAIKPQPGESPWREIPWFTNVTEARRAALRLDRPLVIFTAADGSPLSRT